jgi:pyroglutamyl-peptidase
MALTVLVTGFGPFPGAPFNPTAALVAALVRRRRPAFADLRRIGHVFRTSYAAVDADLPDLIRRHRPDVLLMFGLAARTPHMRIETHARNRRSVLATDVAGLVPAATAIRAEGAAALAGRAPFARLLAAARTARVPARLSCDAGRYLCNYIYRRALELPDGATPRIVVFVHVPRVTHGPRPRRRARRRSITLPELVRAGETILCALAAAARAR